MPAEPNEPPARPARIIVPGAEPRAEEAGPPRIVAPGGPDPEAAPVAPRIVLPPGVARETEADVPEYPRLRRSSFAGIRSFSQRSSSLSGRRLLDGGIRWSRLLLTLR